MLKIARLFWGQSSGESMDLLSCQSDASNKTSAKEANTCSFKIQIIKILAISLPNNH